MFHDYAETALRFGLQPRYFLLGTTAIISGHSVSFNEEMAKCLEDGLRFIETLVTDDAIMRVEEKVKIDKYTFEEGAKGTSDLAIVYLKQRKIVIFDWKYGYEPVSPVENDQACLYGLGVWETWAGELFDWNPDGIEVEFIIWQPRVPHGGGIWPTTMEWLLEEGERIQADAKATYAPDAPRVPGTKQCAYCKAAGKCAALARHNLEQWSLRFDEIDNDLEFGIPPADPDIEEWTQDRKAYVLLHRKLFDRWFMRLHNEVVAELAQGRKVPYLKLAAGDKGNRVWDKSFVDSAERVLEKELGEKAYTKKLLSPAEAQKALGLKRYRELVGKYVTQPPGKPILVPTTDPRPELPTYGDMFDEIAEDAA